MASADVKIPCGEFEQRQRIIHFAVVDSRKLSYNFPKISLDIIIFSTSLVPSYISSTLAAR